MLTVALFTAGAVLTDTASSLYGQSGDSLQQKLASQFTLTKLTDGGDIAAAGVVLVLQKKGLWMYSTASKLPPLNNYQNDKMSKSTMRDMQITMLTKGNTGFIDLPKRSFAAGETCWVIGLGIEKDGIVFRLYSAPYGDTRYYGDLKFPFKKGSPPEPDEALARIAEVLAQSGAPGAGATGAGVLRGGPLLHLPATFVSAQTPTDQLQLNADNSFSLQEAGQTYRGTFAINGNSLEITIPDTNTKTTMTIQGSNLTDPSGRIWALRE